MSLRPTITVALALVLTYSALATLFWCLAGQVDHDEHQFMASASMVARHWQHPYRDFAYFHMPNLVYVYSLFFLTPYPFLLARLFVGLCAFGICLTIYGHARTVFGDRPGIFGRLAPACILLLITHSFLFRVAAGHVWNHAASTLCAVVAFLLQCHAIRTTNRTRFVFLAGLTLGMGMGIRLTVAPLVVPFLLAIWLFAGGTARRKGWESVVLCGGILVANLPAVFFLLTSPSEWWFGNIVYPSLNTLYRDVAGYPVAMDLARKLAYLATDIVAAPTVLLILVVALYSLVLVGIDARRTGTRPRFEIAFLMLCLPFVYVGAIAPTPSWMQYYFALIPFLLLLSVHALASLRSLAFFESAVLLLGVAATLSLPYGSPLPRGDTFRALSSPHTLVGLDLHQQSRAIRDYVDAAEGNDEILTLSPLYAVIADLPIYREFVTGPFGWRVSPLLSRQDAVDLGLPVPAEIESFVRERRPRAILTGKEPELEQPIATAAQKLGYEPLTLPSGIVVWRRSASSLPGGERR